MIRSSIEMNETPRTSQRIKTRLKRLHYYDSMSTSTDNIAETSKDSPDRNIDKYALCTSGAVVSSASCASSCQTQNSVVSSLQNNSDGVNVNYLHNRNSLSHREQLHDNIESPKSVKMTKCHNNQQTMKPMAKMDASQNALTDVKKDVKVSIRDRRMNDDDDASSFTDSDSVSDVVDMSSDFTITPLTTERLLADNNNSNNNINNNKKSMSAWSRTNIPQRMSADFTSSSVAGNVHKSSQVRDSSLLSNGDIANVSPRYINGKLPGNIQKNSDTLANPNICTTHSPRNLKKSKSCRSSSNQPSICSSGNEINDVKPEVGLVLTASNQNDSGKTVKQINLCNLESVLGKDRMERLLRNLRDIEMVSDAHESPNASAEKVDLAMDGEESHKDAPAADEQFVLKCQPPLSLMILNDEKCVQPEKFTNTIDRCSVDEARKSSGRVIHVLDDDDRIEDSCGSNRNKTMERNPSSPGGSTAGLTATVANRLVHCSLRVNEIYARASKLTEAVAPNVHCQDYNVKTTNSLPPWMMMTDLLRDSHSPRDKSSSAQRVTTDSDVDDGNGHWDSKMKFPENLSLSTSLQVIDDNDKKATKTGMLRESSHQHLKCVATNSRTLEQSESSDGSVKQTENNKSRKPQQRDVSAAVDRELSSNQAARSDNHSEPVHTEICQTQRDEISSSSSDNDSGVQGGNNTKYTKPRMTVAASLHIAAHGESQVKNRTLPARQSCHPVVLGTSYNKSSSVEQHINGIRNVMQKSRANSQDIDDVLPESVAKEPEANPYSKDSIQRYFKSLENAYAENSDYGHVAYNPILSSPAPVSGEDHRVPSDKSKLSKQSGAGTFSNAVATKPVGTNNACSRVDELTRRLLQSIDQNDDELFSRLATTFAAEESRRPRDVACVRDSDQFLYDDAAEFDHSSHDRLPDSLKNELAVDLGESVTSVMMKKQKASMSSDFWAPNSSDKRAPELPCVADSLMFDYADFENPTAGLPESLKEQLRLDLHESCDTRESYLLVPEKSQCPAPSVTAKKPKYPAPKTIKSSQRNKGKTDDNSCVIEARCTDSQCLDHPLVSKSVASRSRNVRNESRSQKLLKCNDSCDDSSEDVHFKTADFLRYKKDRRIEDMRQSAEDGDVVMSLRKSRSQSAALVGSRLSRSSTLISAEWNGKPAGTLREGQLDVHEAIGSGSKTRELSPTRASRHSASPERPRVAAHSPNRKDRSSFGDKRLVHPSTSNSTIFTPFKGDLRRCHTAVSAEEFGKYALMSPRIKAGELSMMLCLPDEMLLTIFEYLALSDIARCARVCKTFNRIAMDNTLWRRIVVRKRMLHDSSLNRIGQHQPISVELIQCRGDDVTPDGVRDLFRQCAESLQELNITGCKHGQLTGDTLLLHASRCQYIHHIDASWTDVGPSAVIALSDTCHCLTSVCLNGCQAITDEVVQSLVNKHGASLVTLELFGLFSLTHVALFAIGKFCPNLVTLNVGQCWKLSDGSIAQLSTRTPLLENLDIRGCKQVKDHTVHQVVQNCSRLRTLSVANCANITDSSLAEIATRCPQLKSIDVCGCNKISNIGLKSLVTGCQQLEYIDISSTAINHRGITSVSNACRQYLQIIKLNFCKQISQKSLVRLARNCKRLRKLYMYGVTSVRNTDDIVMANPNVWIEK